jgi:hypothetical protein
MTRLRVALLLCGPRAGTVCAELALANGSNNAKEHRNA